MFNKLHLLSDGKRTRQLPRTVDLQRVVITVTVEEHHHYLTKGDVGENAKVNWIIIWNL